MTYIWAALTLSGLGFMVAVYALFIGDDRMIDGIRRAWDEGGTTSLSYESSES